MMWTDPIGQKHAACIYTPPAATTSSKRPLLVFLPGTFGSAADTYNLTSLRTESGHVRPRRRRHTRTGFILASAQERNLQNPDSQFAGAQWDYLFRSLGSPSCNPDMNGVDQLIDTLVATGTVDTQRIYVTGWSAGAIFGMMYGIVRHSNPTPGGHFVASVSVYAGFDPFNNLADGLVPSCQLTTYPPPTVPIQIVHRVCDALVACDDTQRTAFGLPPGDSVEGWLAMLKSPLGDTVLSDQIIDHSGVAATACTAPPVCTEAIGIDNHIHWPDGVADNGGHDWEPTMLQFMAAHPML